MEVIIVAVIIIILLLFVFAIYCDKCRRRPMRTEYFVKGPLLQKEDLREDPSGLSMNYVNISDNLTFSPEYSSLARPNIGVPFSTYTEPPRIGITHPMSNELLNPDYDYYGMYPKNNTFTGMERPVRATEGTFVLGGKLENIPPEMPYIDDSNAIVNFNYADYSTVHPLADGDGWKAWNQNTKGWNGKGTYNDYPNYNYIGAWRGEDLSYPSTIWLGAKIW